MITYDLKDFSVTPFGRYKTDSPYSAEAFREILISKLNEAIEQEDVVTIILDNVYGLGSSFLEESFGGLVRKGYFTKDQLLSSSPRLLNFETEHNFYLEEIEEYINTART